MADHAAITEAEFLAEQPYDANDPKQVNAARKKAARQRKAELDFVYAIMSQPQGRKWMWDLIATCKSFGNPIIPGDPYLTYTNLGAQNIGKKLLQDIWEGAPDQYLDMVKENN